MLGKEDDKTMRIALASDHAGYPLKQHLLDYLRGRFGG